MRWNISKKKKRTVVVVSFNRPDQRDEVLKKLKKQQSVSVPTPGAKHSCKIDFWEMLTERQKFVRKAAVATVKCLNMWRNAKIEGHPKAEAVLSGYSDVAMDGTTAHYEEWYAQLKPLVSRAGFKEGPLGSNQTFCYQFEMVGLASTVAKRLPYMTAEERESYDLPPYTA